MNTYDIVLRGGRVVDGTGNPWYRADVGIRGGKIARIGRIAASEGKDSVDLADRVLAPGFIDGHSHSDFSLFVDPLSLNKLRQGVTTEVIGNCGISAAPVRPESLEHLRRYVGFAAAGADIPWDWTTVGEYLAHLEELNPGINIAAYVGHGSIRLAVLGMDGRKPDRSEMEAMRNLTARAMEDGAFGLSSGLIYPPGVYSDTEEMIELCRVVKAYGGVYATHMRSESNGVLDSVAETIRVARMAGIPAIISHHKIGGKSNWGKSARTLQMIEEAREQGLDIVFDQYPYIAGNTTLSAILPPWVQIGGVKKVIENLTDPDIRARIVDEIEHDRGGWENFVSFCGWEGIHVIYAPRRPEIEGKNMLQIAAALSKTPVDAALDTIVEQGGAASAIYFVMCEADVREIMGYRAGMVGSDSVPVPPQVRSHPRVNGTFPRVLGKYVREERVLTLEDAVRKMTSFPARWFGLTGKGLVAEGMDADLVVFDPAEIIDSATYDEPALAPRGIDYVFVHGMLTIVGTEPTGRRAGQVLRRGR